MNSDKSPKDSSKESSRMSIDSNSTPPPNFQLPPEYWWNSSIPKNNLGSFDDNSQLLSSTPSGYIPNDGTFSPRPSKSKYTVNMQSHYPPSTLDWGEPSFDVDCSDDGDYSEGSIPQKIPAQNALVQNVPAQNNVPVQNNIPAQDDGFQYLDFDMWNDDEIINQLHLSNSLFNDESSNHDAIDIHQKDVPAPAPSRAPARTSARTPSRAPARTSERTTAKAPVRGRQPYPKPSFQPPIIQNNGSKYIYNSLESVFGHWLNTLEINALTKHHYTLRHIKLIKILDKKGIYQYNEKEISDYCDTYMQNCGHRFVGDFKAVIKKFFIWINNPNICRYIRLSNNPNEDLLISCHQQQLGPQIDDATKIKSKCLAEIFNKWSKTLKNDAVTNSNYKMHILDFILFLTRLGTLQPTKQNIIRFLKGKFNEKGYIIPDECKKAIKSFLQFIEQMGTPQDPKVYDLLDSNIDIK